MRTRRHIVREAPPGRPGSTSLPMDANRDGRLPAPSTRPCADFRPVGERRDGDPPGRYRRRYIDACALAAEAGTALRANAAWHAGGFTSCGMAAWRRVWTRERAGSGGRNASVPLAIFMLRRWQRRPLLAISRRHGGGLSAGRHSRGSGTEPLGEEGPPRPSPGDTLRAHPGTLFAFARVGVCAGMRARPRAELHGPAWD
jgi:hypothetical protein